MTGLIYAVVVSTMAACSENPMAIRFNNCGETYYELQTSKRPSEGLFGCTSGEIDDCDYLYDMAESLNMANERRTKELKFYSIEGEFKKVCGSGVEVDLNGDCP